MAKSSKLSDADTGMRLVSQHPADFYVHVGKSGKRYTFPRGVPIQVDALDVPGMMALVLPEVIGCCGTNTPERELFVEVRS
jgi:hypothetical protein